MIGIDSMKSVLSKSLILSSAIVASSMSFSTLSYADVTITQGKTSIPAGNATAESDLTIKNEKLAFALAIGSPPPWGVARGCIVDIANVLPDGSLSNDRVAFADFIPNNWSGWPTTYQKVDIITDTPELAVVKVTRDFADVTISTTYSLKSGSDLIHVTTTMDNQGEDLNDMLSGYTLWPDGGFKFAVPGYAGVEKSKVKDPISDRFVGYDKDWGIALHAPYFDQFKYKGRDLYKKHSLKNNQSITFEGDYQVLASGNLAPVVKAEIERKQLTSGSISGMVKSQDGKIVDQPAVIVQKEGAPYIWVIGENGQYNLDLPVGEYQVYATGKGYSDSKKHTIKITSGKTVKRSFNDLQAPGKVRFNISDINNQQALDAKIQIAEGNKPLIEFLGSKTFFTELDQVGQAEFTLAPGDYKFNILAGGNFLSSATSVQATVKSNQVSQIDGQVDIKSYPTQKGWYSADLHHHADVLEGSTSPEYLVRSQLAAGLSVAFVSDHDSTKNHKEIESLTQKREMPFIPSIELSPSWGHFNAFPLEIGATLSVDPGVDSIHDIIKDAHKMGAMAVASNHPYIPYGYLSSLEKDNVPGGFNPNIDFIEINSEVDYSKAVEKARDFWNRGLPYYYTAGSDTHDVWNETTGHNRMFAFTGNKPSAEAFTQAMKNGRAYASFGPLIYPQDVMFGDTLKVTEKQARQVQFDLVSVNGLKSVTLLGNEGVISELNLSGEKQSISFDVPNKDGWLSLVVEDSSENKAYSNPIWIKSVTASQF